MGQLHSRQPLHGLPNPPIPLWGRRGAEQSSQPHSLTLDFGDEGPGGCQGLQGVEQRVLADDLAQDAQGFTQALVGQRPLGLLGVCKRGGLRCCIPVPRPCPVSPSRVPAPCLCSASLSLPCLPPSHPLPATSQAGTGHLPDHAANPPGLGASQKWHGHILLVQHLPTPTAASLLPSLVLAEGQPDL